MKPRHLFYTVAILGFLYTPSASYASGGEPNVYFSFPPYVDLDTENPGSEYIYFWDNPTRMAMPILFPDYDRYDLMDNKETPEQKTARDAANGTKSYAAYQIATEAFNISDYEKALTLYQQLHDRKKSLKSKLYNFFGQKSDDWATEAATYMIGRTQMIMAQTLWDGYSDVTQTIDEKLIEQAGKSFETYLKEYPDGLYANSARNIKRRLLLLAGKDKALSDSIREALHNPEDAQNPFLFREFINYASDAPINVKTDAIPIILYTWLGNDPITEQDLKDFENRQQDTEANHDLYNMIRAIGLYRTGKYKELTEDIPAASETANHTLALSLLSLRGRSYIKQEQYDQARATFVKMLERASTEDERESIELEIARTKIMEDDTKWLFSKNSPLKNEKVLAAIAQNALSDEELVASLRDSPSADKRRFLAQELMLRYLLSRQFEQLDALFKTEKKTDIPKIFAKIKSTISALARNPKDETALLEIATYEYQNFITPIHTFDDTYHTPYYDFSAYDQIKSWCTPCQKTEEKRASYEPPYTIFLEVAQNLKSKEKSETEAQALHYVVTCFRGNSFQKQCKWDKTFENKGKQAFQRLHKIYPDSTWAKKTPYFYDDPIY